MGPTPNPTDSPTLEPTGSPTAALPESGTPVNTIFPPSSPMDSFGCVQKLRYSRAIDGNTRQYSCDRKGLHDQEAGLIISSPQMSIAKGLRIYAHWNCKWCDAVSYTLQGRSGPDAFLDYRFTFTTRNPTSRYLKIAELEVPGVLLP